MLKFIYKNKMSIPKIYRLTNKFKYFGVFQGQFFMFVFVLGSNPIQFRNNKLTRY